MKVKYAYKVNILAKVRPNKSFEFTTSREPNRRTMYRALRELAPSQMEFNDPSTKAAHLRSLSEVVRFWPQQLEAVKSGERDWTQVCCAEVEIGQITLTRIEVYS